MRIELTVYTFENCTTDIILHDHMPFDILLIMLKYEN